MIDILCKDIIRNYHINTFVETGTDKAETVAQISRWFAEFYPEFGTIVSDYSDGAKSYNIWNQSIRYPVFDNIKNSSLEIHTVDTDDFSFQRAARIFKSNPHIHAHKGNSNEFLAQLLADEIQTGTAKKNYLFFLDAHWDEYWPLRDEIAVINKLNKYMIIIDDFFVPKKSNPAFPHGNFGFDLYKGKILNWAYISDLFQNKKDIHVFYPQRSNRDRRGWVMITNGYSNQELESFKKMPLFEISLDDARHTQAVKTTLLTYLDIRNLSKQIFSISFLRNLNRKFEHLTNAQGR